MSSPVNDNPLLTHILQRLHNDISRIEHLIHTVHQDVNFLLEAGQLTSEDAQLILSKVPALIHQHSHSPLSHRRDSTLGHGGHRSRLSLDSAGNPSSLNDLNDTVAPPSYPSLENMNIPPLRSSLPPLPLPLNNNGPPAPKRQARALWDYANLDEPEDLAFEKGAIIEVIKENNEDWWTGKVNGKTGLFPSNYVEILQHPLPIWSTQQQPPPPTTATKARPPPESAPRYIPYNNKSEPVPIPPSSKPSLPIPTPPQEEKQPKYANLKSTMINSAANGAGFGAGAAIGGSIVRAIF